MRIKRRGALLSGVAAAVAAVIGFAHFHRSGAAACAAASAADAQTDPQLVAGNTTFAFDLFQAIAKDDTANIVYSPISISEAAAMLNAGADVQTQTQIAQALRFALPPDKLDPAFQALNTDLANNAQNPAGTWCNATALWVDRSYAVNPSYLSQVKANYATDVQSADFKGNATGAGEQIRQWVQDQTQGGIPDFALQVNPDTALALVSAVYFKNQWDSPFEPPGTSDKPFTLLNGQPVSVPMMHKAEHSFPYLKTDQYQAIELPYKDGHVSMVIIMPNDGQFDAVEASLSADQFNQALTGLADTRLVLSMPRFKFKYALPLGPVLQGLGITDAFDPVKANFAKLQGSAQEPPVYVGAAIHQAFISVDENGTEAAGASGFNQVFGALPGVPQFVTIDHPFIFAIRDEETGTLLFVGRVVNPTA